MTKLEVAMNLLQHFHRFQEKPFSREALLSLWTMCVGGIVPQWTKVWALNSGETGIVAPGHYLHTRLRCCWFSFPHEHNEKTITLKLRVYVSREQGLWFSVWIPVSGSQSSLEGKSLQESQRTLALKGQICPQQILNGKLVMDEIGTIRWLISTL